jgi:hypothetical protein
MRQKLKAAEKANKYYNGCFQKNIDAIKSIMPKGVTRGDIYITLGTPWIPIDVVNDFMKHIFGRYPEFGDHAKSIIGHDSVTGMWEIREKARRRKYYGSIKMTSTYGTRRMDALTILERTLNMQSIKIFDMVRSDETKSGKKRALNKEETLLALEKQKLLIESFRQWVWKDEERSKRLEEIFDKKFGCIRKRHFDGSFLEFPTLSPDVKLDPYQKNAVARILFSPNALIAHNVGSGKTYIMIAAGMELKRMGISGKNMYVVPNGIITQWEQIFEAMYPNAEILVVSPKNFGKKDRYEMLMNIKYNTYDAIIIAASCFDRIDVSVKYQLELLRERVEYIKKIEKEDNKKNTTKGLEKKRESLEKELHELEFKNSLDLYDELSFDELGINTLFVDEAHNYKNVPIDTNIEGVLGINKNGSKKCSDMLLKVRCVKRQNNGRGVVFATGTPVTNSITDAYIMQRYLQENELQLADINNFDAWVAMFAEKSDEFEIDVDTKNYRMSARLAKFHNLTELSTLFSMVADFYETSDLDLNLDVPEFNGYSDCLIEKTDRFRLFLEDISRRADMVRSGRISRKEDNMLKITTDGRMAALDLRLVQADAGFSEQSKVFRCARNVYRIYLKTMENKSTQLIFCDTSTPKSGFNMYDELRSLLVAMGIENDEIEYIHSANTENKKKTLFKRVNKGEVRVLIGSTSKLGTGVNVQERLFAIHHLDIPWRPSDMVQREGRILRQGNRNKCVEIYRYITESSFDAYSWQLLETKQRFITQLVSGELETRDSNDIDDMTLNYAEVKALAIGNPLIKQRVETANELNRYIVLQRKYVEKQERLVCDLDELLHKIEHQKILIDNCGKDKLIYEKNKREYTKKERKALRERLAAQLSDYHQMDAEKVAEEYQGFKIILPKNMIKSYEFLWLEANGRYKVDTRADKMILANVDKKLDGLETLYDDYCRGMAIFADRQNDIESELTKQESYTETISLLKEKVKRIDVELGVDKNECNQSK